jgi:hypothetical protein
VDASARSDVEAAAPSCPGYAAPNVPAMCKACTAGQKGCPATLQPNGCYGGYYCELSDIDCQPMTHACDAGRPEAGKSD